MLNSFEFVRCGEYGSGLKTKSSRSIDIVVCKRYTGIHIIETVNDAIIEIYV